MFDLRIGLWTSNSDPWPALVEQWRTIEALGFDCAGIPDHFMPTGGSVDVPFHEGWTLLTALAALTPRLRVAMLVSGNTYRNPALVAKMATTLDHITGGRVDLGIGAGWYEPEHTAYDFPFPAAGERVDMLSEAIDIIRALSSGGRTTYEGQYYTIKDAPFAPTPVQTSGLPIMVGAQGNRMLRLVAEKADIWNLNDTPERMAELGATLNRHCDATGRDPATIRWSAFSFPRILTEDPFDSVDAFRRLIGAYLDAGASEITLKMPRPDQYGVLQQVADVLPLIRDEYRARRARA